MKEYLLIRNWRIEYFKYLEDGKIQQMRANKILIKMEINQINDLNNIN